jgi:hypothetical protein
VNDHSEIRIGEFIFHYDSRGKLWLSKDGGEGMEIGDVSLGVLETVLEAFWEANF